jgi:hypothetical protein
VPADEVSVTDPPEQNVVGPPVVIVGVAGGWFTVTFVPVDVAVQVPLLTVTVYVPAVETVIDCVVAPVDQVFPVAEDEVNVTLPPVQNVVDPLAEMVGVAGSGFTITVVATDVAVQVPLLTVTVYVPADVTVIDLVVAPVDHVFPVAEDEVNVTLPPAQNVVDPVAEIVGVAGNVFTVTIVVAEVATHPEALETVTV